jgi:ATP-dependent transcriptional regulator
LPTGLVRSRPRLLLAQAQLAIASGRVEEMEPLLDAAERAAPGAAGEPFEPTVGRAGSMLVNVPALIAIRRAFSPSSAATPKPGRRSPRGPWPSAARASGC